MTDQSLTKRIMYAAVLLTAGLTRCIPAAAADKMPATQQNELVQKFCAVCHDDAQMVGGLSLQHFDAAHADPGLVAMLARKLNDGALGAAGIKPLPDRATQDAFLAALSEEAAGAREWVVSRSGSLISVSTVREAAVAANPNKTNLYRLKVTCDLDKRQGNTQLAWAPADVAGSGGTLSAGADSAAPVAFPIANGLGNVHLYTTTEHDGPKLPTGLPQRTLNVSGPIPGDAVSFGFDSLPEETRETLSTCFASRQ
jgi:cytochrome c551/c552